MIGLLWFAAAPAFAGKPEVPTEAKVLAAERHRLETDLDKLAQKLSWDGVERTYAKMLALQVPLDTHVHYTAALSAESRGDVNLAWLRLERALRDLPALKEKPLANGVDPKKTLPEQVVEIEGDGLAARDALDRLKSMYGRAVIAVSPNRLPALVRLGSKPFTLTEREAIKQAQSALSVGFAFEGLLPNGRYMVDGEMFEVTTEAPVTVNVGL